MAEKTKNREKVSLEELTQNFTETQLLYLLGEFLLMEVDQKAEIQYAEGEEPHHLIFKMKNGRQIALLVMKVL